MKKAVRNIIVVISAVVIAAVFGMAYYAGASLRKPLVCKGLNVIIADSTTNSFVSKAEVSRILQKEYGTYMNVAIDSINLDKIEKLLETKSAINKTEAVGAIMLMLKDEASRYKAAILHMSLWLTDIFLQ